MTPAGAAGTASGPYRAEPPHVEGTDGLREEMRDVLIGHPIGTGYYGLTVGTDEASEIADALLSGPLAPLLAAQATVQRVEHLYAVLVEGGAVFATLPDLRRALDAS